MLLSISILTWAQVIIENPALPENQKERRIVPLEEVMRIKDNGQEVVFRIPKNITLTEDGSIYLIDFTKSSHVYKFNRNGKYIHRFLSQGVGPQESQWSLYFILHGDRIRIQSWNPPKILDFNQDGKFIKEIKTRNTQLLNYLKMVDGKIYGILNEVQYSKAKGQDGITETYYYLYEISDDFQDWKKIYEIPIKIKKRRNRWQRLVKTAFVEHGHYLYFVNSDIYKITKFDLLKKKVDRVITREYERQSAAKSKIEKDVFNTPMKTEKPNYFFDIKQIAIYKDCLWVRTSTVRNGGKEHLVDIFNKNGIYIDSYYLQFPSGQQEMHFYTHGTLNDDGFIFVPERDKEGEISIGKYKIKGSVVK